MFVSVMDNIFVSEANTNLGTTPSLHPPPSHSIDLAAFDLDEALAPAAHSCRRFAQSQSLVATLPAVQHTDATTDAVCSVCMEGFDSDENKQIPCGHVYHSGCITAWVSRSNSCPLCRSHIFLHSH
ncbi:hypothetical protein K1719_009696 [Acacia pycnantha]|nr:hypothetical protein K1719_009696 [Acacia pycnantha]